MQVEGLQGLIVIQPNNVANSVKIREKVKSAATLLEFGSYSSCPDRNVHVNPL